MASKCVSHRSLDESEDFELFVSEEVNIQSRSSKPPLFNTSFASVINSSNCISSSTPVTRLSTQKLFERPDSTKDMRFRDNEDRMKKLQYSFPISHRYAHYDNVRITEIRLRS
ncbi:hypothetical protein CDAR_226071 [Caerostris darwini]|uniref:Uncharacterized protein n=1 Tax=Caerostris darwini TaxID=1538125 RepID=A0AAV4ULE4_9ARAC|nr:hypothetical protein CDAR_226071 [Caerostris darwini]